MLSGLLHGCKVMGEVRFCPHRSPKPQYFEFYLVFFGFRDSLCLELRHSGTLLSVPKRPANVAKLFGLERDELRSLNCNGVPLVLGGCNDRDLLKPCSNCFCCTQTGMLCSLFHLLRGKPFCIGRLRLL